MTTDKSKWPAKFLLPDIIAGLLEWQPLAIEIRHSGLCPNCDHDAEVSYRLSDWEQDNRCEFEEYCGYYCGYCGWGEAGSRLIEN